MESEEYQGYVELKVCGIIFHVFSRYEFVPTTLPCMVDGHEGRRRFVRLRTKIRVEDRNGVEFKAEYNFSLWKEILARLEELENNSKKVVFCEECRELLKIATMKEVKDVK